MGAVHILLKRVVAEIITKRCEMGAQMAPKIELNSVRGVQKSPQKGIQNRSRKKVAPRTPRGQDILAGPGPRRRIKEEVNLPLWGGRFGLEGKENARRDLHADPMGRRINYLIA